MLLLIDNYDSFTYNLVQYFGELGADVRVYRNDELTLETASDLMPDFVVISPGPCTPAEAGISCELVRQLGPRVPILGVCLGHQCIGEAYGGRVVRAPQPVHGKSSAIFHNGTGLFRGVPNGFTAGRYHSLILDRESLPETLQISASTEDGVIMAIQHQDFPMSGVQFHPESVLTECGKQVLANFLAQRTTPSQRMPHSSVVPAVR